MLYKNVYYFYIIDVLMLKIIIKNYYGDIDINMWFVVCDCK